MAKMKAPKAGSSKIAKAVVDRLEVGKKIPAKARTPRPKPKADATPPAPHPTSKPNTDPKAPHPKYPDRNADGTYRGGDAPNGGKVAEQRRLDLLERRYGRIERRQVKSTVPGSNHGRFYDGLAKNPDGTYTAIEVKSGNARLTPQQREFDTLVSRENPARAKLDGKEIVITKVILSDKA
ncbi:hypothetical protein [uncultured Tessaracoccus sp.]|uniref:hypothetical protein n=1 Tax=uncultured Tessaracoccus sp. TaxID=905023 RepID=UPI00262FBEE8|nr:hypothetical protein [uncultured Tessaracoccus sp.]